VTRPQAAVARRLARRPVLGAAALGAAVALVLPGAPARAVQDLRSGSWWRSQPDGAPLPAPPRVPDGGLWVASDAAGPSAVSAVRIDLDPGESSPSLRLRVHSNQSSASPDVVACPATGPWQPATAGPWSSRPPSDCGRGKAAGALSADGTTMTFDLAALAVGGAVDVVIQPPPQQPAASPPPSPVPGLPPAPDTPTPGSPTYDLTFERPTPADVTVTPAAAAAAAPAPEGAALTEPGTTSPPDLAVPAAPSFAPSSAVTQASTALGPTAAQPVLSSGPAPAAAAGSQSGLGLRQAAAHQGRADRVAAGVAFVVLALWAWRVMSAEGARTGGGPLRPRLTLYDAPELLTAEVPRRYGSRPRIGLPPALR